MGARVSGMGSCRHPYRRRRHVRRALLPPDRTDQPRHRQPCLERADFRPGGAGNVLHRSGRGCHRSQRLQWRPLRRNPGRSRTGSPGPAPDSAGQPRTSRRSPRRSGSRLSRESRPIRSHARMAVPPQISLPGQRERQPANPIDTAGISLPRRLSRAIVWARQPAAEGEEDGKQDTGR
jgi:hypothetical protein